MKSVKVKDIRSVGVKRVIDLTVVKNHTFITQNGLVVHNCNSTQPALRNFMEEYSKNCGFILTCNFKNRIIEPLHSRCTVIDFNFNKKEKIELAAQMYKRTRSILKQENIEHSNEVVAEIVKKYFPDNRRILNELQRYSASGKIDTGILNNLQETTLNNLVKSLKEKNFTEVRKWAFENSDADSSQIFRTLYDKITAFIHPSSVPQLVLILADYQYKAAFVADSEINVVACLTEIMANCEFQ